MHRVNASPRIRPGTWIALLRGINVVGNNMLPMKELAALLAAQGLAEVRTYIQSGNVVFRSSNARAAELAQRIGNAIEGRHGFRPHVLVLSVQALQRAATANPFPEAVVDPKSLHLFFLSKAPKTPGLDALARVQSATERFALAGSTFYLHTPDGFGISKLAKQAEKALGVAATARNWRTVCALLEMTSMPDGR